HPKSWQDIENVTKILTTFFQRSNRQPKPSKGIIRIPRWYHATPYKTGKGKGLLKLVTSGQQNVEHLKKFEGAWVADKIEKFGNNVLCYTNLCPLTPTPVIG